MIRTLFVLLSAVVFLIATLPVLLILWIIGKFNPDKSDRAAYHMICFIFRVIAFFSGAKVTMVGLDRIPKDTAVVYTANHRSIFDVILTYYRLPDMTSFVAKKELGSIPLFSIWAKHMRCLLFNRDNLKEGAKMILDGIKYLKAGTSVFICPEGTRNKNESELPLLPFHEGSFRLSLKSGVPIIPVSIINTADILEAHFPRIKSVPVYIEFGAPIYPSDIPAEYRKKEGEYIRSVMEETISGHKN